MNSWNPYNTLNLQKLEATDLFQSAHRKLRENRWYKPVLDYVEELTKVNRVYTVSGFGALMIVILLLEYGTSLITGCVGFIFPAYKTLRELETPETGVGRKWLLYWFLHAALSFFEIVFFFLSWIPGYWFFKRSLVSWRWYSAAITPGIRNNNIFVFSKSLFLFWCYAPMQRNGADVIYGYVIRPVFQKNREAIDNVVNQVTRTAHSIYTDSEVHTNTDGHQHQN